MSRAQFSMLRPKDQARGVDHGYPLWVVRRRHGRVDTVMNIDNIENFETVISWLGL